MAIHNERGKLGEDLACRFLQNLGYSILERNKRLGKNEIDILAEKDKVIHIVEVKTVREGSFISPEDNLTRRKWGHVYHSALLLENSESFHGKRLQIDLVCVYLNEENRKARIKILSNIHME